MPRAHLHNISAMWLLTSYFHKQRIIKPAGKCTYFTISKDSFFGCGNLHAFLSAEFTEETVGKKKCLCSFLPADVINHKSQDRWNCCRGLEISTTLPQPLHLLFCDTAKQTKITWYSSSIFVFMFICLFCPQHCLVYLLFGLKNRLDWD